MRLLLTLSLLALASCASNPMKRCDGPFSQADVLYCPDQVQGAFRECEKPKHLYLGCVTPQ